MTQVASIVRCWKKGVTSSVSRGKEGLVTYNGVDGIWCVYNIVDLEKSHTKGNESKTLVDIYINSWMV